MNLSIFNFNTEQRLFGYKILLFGIGFILISYALVFSNLNLPGSIPQASQLLSSPNQWEAITLGNSHNKAINFDEIEINGHHLWHAGGDFFENIHKIVQITPQLPNLHTVIITSSYFSWYQDNHELRNSNRPIVHASIPGFHFDKNDLKSLFYGKSYYFNLFEKIMRDDNWTAVVRQLLSPQAPDLLNIMPDGQFTGESYLDCKYPDKSEMIDTLSLESVNRHYKMQNDSISGRPDVHVAAYYALVETIEYLQERNIRVVFYTPPYFYRYTELYDADIVADAHRSMKQIQAEYGVEYYDYSTDEEFIYDHTLFTDPDHLNLCGAKKFSAKFRTVLLDEEK